ncbi:MAG: phosphatidate cytidylyltransferase [Clostridia bacterium]|nr:phosphatidate cytidylyltransferase [Clostridia bacterium]
MKKRVFTGVIYAAILAVCIVLKVYLPPAFGSIAFDVFFFAATVIGAYEYLRAAKMRSILQYAIAFAYCIVVIPAYVLAKYMGITGQLVVIILFAIACFTLFVAFVYDNEHAAFEDVTKAMLCMLYVGVMGVILASCNHFDDEGNALASLMLLFVVTPLTDVMAFFVGSLLGRFFPKKIAPKLSPKKTLVGSIGGLLGGVLGALVVYYFFTEIFKKSIVCNINLPYVYIFVIIGVIASLFGQAGDLFESAIKRSFGVKDMGDLLPGHGGVLDRLDSTFFAGVVVYACFWAITAF